MLCVAVLSSLDAFSTSFCVCMCVCVCSCVSDAQAHAFILDVFVA